MVPLCLIRAHRLQDQCGTSILLFHPEIAIAPSLAIRIQVHILNLRSYSNDFLERSG